MVFWYVKPTEQHSNWGDPSRSKDSSAWMAGGLLTASGCFKKPFQTYEAGG